MESLGESSRSIAIAIDLIVMARLGATENRESGAASITDALDRTASSSHSTDQSAVTLFFFISMQKFHFSLENEQFQSLASKRLTMRVQY